jgi:hypothetical protein
MAVPFANAIYIFTERGDVFRLSRDDVGRVTLERVAALR